MKYRFKTLEELRKTKDVTEDSHEHFFYKGPIRSERLYSFTPYLAQFCGKEIKSRDVLRFEGYFVHPWMITEVSFIQRHNDNLQEIAKGD